MRDDRGVTTPDDGDWVVAVDVRRAPWVVATAGGGGVRMQGADGAGAGPLDLAASAHPDHAPLAVVVVHPATWDAAAVSMVLDDVAEHACGPGWPAPVPLTVPEAVAWRALQFGLVPDHGRLAVLDPVAREAAVVDRDGESLASVGAPVRLQQAGPDVDTPVTDFGVRLVALARQVLDGAPPGPPFVGVLLAGVLPGADADGAELPGLVAQISGRAPLVPGDPARAAALGAAALGWAAATSMPDEPGRAVAGAPAAPMSRASRPSSSPAGGADRPSRMRASAIPRGLRLWAAILGVLVVVAIAAGLGLHRTRAAPAPFTYTCPDGQVVAYSYECTTLAPSAGP
jgi:hypothetical protein